MIVNRDFDRCPPYGEGAFGYGEKDAEMLEELRRWEAQVESSLDDQGRRCFQQYRAGWMRYQERCNRYYFYRGTVHGTGRALRIWESEYGD